MRRIATRPKGAYTTRCVDDRGRDGRHHQPVPIVCRLLANGNAASLTRDVNALLRSYRIVHPDARLSTGALRTTPHRELEVAQTDLQDGCAPHQARRLAVATENH